GRRHRGARRPDHQWHHRRADGVDDGGVDRLRHAHPRHGHGSPPGRAGPGARWADRTAGRRRRGPACRARPARLPGCVEHGTPADRGRPRGADEEFPRSAGRRPSDMYKATVLYGHPDDPEAFDRHYRDVHIPLARRMPALAGWTTTWLRPDFDGNAPAHHLFADLSSHTPEQLQAAFDSEAGRAAADDVEKFATGGVTFLFGPVTDVLNAEVV